MNAARPLPAWASHWAWRRPQPLEVRFAPQAGQLQTREGLVRHGAGAALLRGGDGEQWPVEAARFAEHYEPCPGTQAGKAGRYQSRPQRVAVRQLEGPAGVRAGLRGDVLLGQVGDWLVLYANGECGMVSAAAFARSYELLG